MSTATVRREVVSSHYTIADALDPKFVKGLYDGSNHTWVGLDKKQYVIEEMSNEQLTTAHNEAATKLAQAKTQESFHSREGARTSGQIQKFHHQEQGRLAKNALLFKRKLDDMEREMGKRGLI